MEGLGLPDTLCRAVDITDADTLAAAVSQAEETFGPVDCMVNNAGVMLLGDVATQDPAEWKIMLEVNVLGVLYGVRAVLGGMLERRRGTVINVSSIAGRKTFPSHAVYCATKFAVHALTENIREETSAAGVRFVCVAPGVVETELLGHTTSDQIKDGYKAWKSDMGRALDPEDVARVIRFAYQQPPHVCLREVVVGPTAQGS